MPFNDLKAVEKALDDETAAVMLEVIQGEGGVNVGEESFIQGIEQLCKERNVLLVVDEIQTGIGRTGKAFAYEHYGISPDIITVAKGLGNGFPVGGIIAKASLKEHFGPGTHGSTFGGNPLAMAASKAVLQTVFHNDFLQEVREKSMYLKDLLADKIESFQFVERITGKGMMIGIHCQTDVSHLVPKLLEKGLIVLSAGSNVIRLLPPLTIQKEEMVQAVTLLEETFHSESLLHMK